MGSNTSICRGVMFPLTRVGWASFRIGLHHRLVDLIPEPAVAGLRSSHKDSCSILYPSATEA